MNLIDPLEPEFSENGKIVDYVTSDLLEDRPEERVRQRLQRLLHIQYDYPKNRIAREITIYHGRGEVKDAEGKPIRADVGVFRTVEAARKKDQGQIQIIAETKRPNKEDGYSQLVSYVFNTSSEGAIWFNGEDFRVWRRTDHHLDDWPTLPRIRERWDAVGRRRKSELLELKDPRGTLRRCHDRIHRRGASDDVALIMVRLLLSKWRDEERQGEYTEFYCTSEEFHSADGRAAVAQRIENLFVEVRDAHPTVFDAHETIGASPDEVIEVVTELQNYRLLGESFCELYRREGGYLPCDNEQKEMGFEKIALFADAKRNVTHVAKQIDSGKWISKLGEWDDIKHNTLTALEGEFYGKVVQILKRAVT